MAQFMRIRLGLVRGGQELSVGIEGSAQPPAHRRPLALLGGKEVDLNLLLAVILVELLGGCPTPTTRQASGGDRHLNFYGDRDNLAFKARDLAGVELDYLLLDAEQFKLHPGAPAEPVLCAWGVTTCGSPVLLGLAPGSDEGHDAWAGFLVELGGHGSLPIARID